MCKYIKHSDVVKKFLLLGVCMIKVVQGVVAQDNSPSTSNFARLYVGQVEQPYQIALWHDMWFMTMCNCVSTN